MEDMDTVTCEWCRQERRQCPSCRRIAGVVRQRKYDAAHKEAKQIHNNLPETRAAKKKHETSPAGRATKRSYMKTHYTSDPNFRLGVLLRGRLKSALRGKRKGGSAVRDLGCTIEELRQHLERQFLPAGVYALGVERPAMSWEHQGKHGWHIDHVKPLASFDLTDRQQFLEACHYTNLRPLWAEQNQSEGARRAA